MSETYLEIIDSRMGQPCKTGIRADCVDEAETRKMFESAKQYESKFGLFLLDLIVADTLVDTIFLDEDGVLAVSGITPKEPGEYALYNELVFAETAAAEVKA